MLCAAEVISGTCARMEHPSHAKPATTPNFNSRARHRRHTRCLTRSAGAAPACSATPDTAGNLVLTAHACRVTQVEGELSAAKALADADAKTIKSERAILNAELSIKSKEERKFAFFKKEETEDVNMIKEAELLAAEEEQIAKLGGKIVGISEEAMLNKNK